MKCPHGKEIQILQQNLVVYYLHSDNESSCELLNRLDVSIDEIIETYTDITVKKLTPIVRVALLVSQDFRLGKWCQLLSQTKNPYELRELLSFLEKSLQLVPVDKSNLILSEMYSVFRDNFLINWEIISFGPSGYPDFAHIARSTVLNCQVLPMINLGMDTIDYLSKEIEQENKKKSKNVFEELEDINRKLGL